MSNMQYILHTNYWTWVIYSVYATARHQKRCKDQSSNRSIIERAEPVLLLARQSDWRKSYDAVASQEGQGPGNNVQYARKDLPGSKMSTRRGVKGGSSEIEYQAKSLTY